MRILVVDDSKIHRVLVGGLLEGEEDLEIDYAEDGEVALEKIEAVTPDVVVTDLVMPNMDGLELVDSVRDSHPGLPVILITSQGSEEIAAQALAVGAASYVPKTSLADDLLDTVRESLLVVGERQEAVAALTMMVRNEAEFELENRRALFGPLIGHFKDTFAHVGFGDDNDRMRVCMAVEEALANAAEHGNLELDSKLRESDRNDYFVLAGQRLKETPYRERKVYLSTYASKDEVRFVVRDEGSGFDPTNLPDPTDAANLLKASGRGVMLMRTFMDDVSYNELGNEVTLIKRSNRQDEPQ